MPTKYTKSGRIHFLADIATKFYLEFNYDKEGLGLAISSINQNLCDPPLTEQDLKNIVDNIVKGEPLFIRQTKCTDSWDAQVMAKQYGAKIRYCDSLGGWFMWDGTKWRRDDSFQIHKIANKTADYIGRLGEQKNDIKLVKHSVACEAECKLNSMIRLVRSEPSITMQADEFDNNMYLLNCRNGTLNLETGQLQAHNPTDYITKLVNYSYDANAICPTWLNFLDTIFMGNQETIRFVHKAVGYSLSASIEEQCFFILYGTGMNGKSTFLDTIANVFGDYSLSTHSSTLLEKTNSIPNDVARLKGARLVNALETESNRKLAESVVKNLTGGDKVVARFLNKEFFEFYSTFKIFLATNHKPKISGTDTGIWRRIKYVPFKKVITADECDKKLSKKLVKEYEGILAWAVEGFKLWQQEGLGSAREIDEAVQEYRDESDIFKDYLNDNCVTGNGCSTQASELYKDFLKWCKDNGGLRISRNSLIEYLEAKKFSKEMKGSGLNKGSMFWLGIGLKSGQMEGDFSENERPY